jgi:hypothetical protein
MNKMVLMNEFNKICATRQAAHHIENWVLIILYI